MHLDIAAVEIRSTPPETYFKTQVRVNGMFVIKATLSIVGILQTQ